MKTHFVTSFAFTGVASPKVQEAKGEMRPRSAKMDKFLAKVNGSTRFDAINAATRVGEAVAKSKKAA